jgi:hypothetical protein
MKTIRASLAHSVLAACLVLLVLWPSSAAEFYTNWAATHLSDIPAQSSPLADPDHDGEANLVEFAFGSDPRIAGDFQGLIFPRWGTTNGVFGVEVLGKRQATSQALKSIPLCARGTYRMPTKVSMTKSGAAGQLKTNDFLSTDYKWALGPRRDDGGLPETPFLRPVPNGRLVDNGIKLGEPFQGNSPDLGAFETSAW